MITKKVLCENILRQHCEEKLHMSIPVDIYNLPNVNEIAYGSSTAAVCMEYLGILKDDEVIDYASRRGGLMVLSHNDDKMPDIITLRDILESMKE